MPLTSGGHLDWDDLRFVAAVARTGTLAKAGDALSVDHTTVGRRVSNAERALGLRLFTRSPRGFVPTADGLRLLAPLAALERAAAEVSQAASEQERGTVKVTAPETFGISWVAPCLARIAATLPSVSFEVLPSGQVLDLSRREAELAIRAFRTKHASVVSRRLGAVQYALYASRRWLSRHRSMGVESLHECPLLLPSDGVEREWVLRLVPSPRVVLKSELSLALAEAAKADAGVAVLPRYLGDAEPSLKRLPRADEPSETLWLTVHRDVRHSPRVRSVLEALAAEGARSLQR